VACDIVKSDIGVVYDGSVAEHASVCTDTQQIIHRSVLSPADDNVQTMRLNLICEQENVDPILHSRQNDETSKESEQLITACDDEPWSIPLSNPKD
jgi:hypothetical protein